MGEILRIHAPGEIRFDAYDEPALGAAQVRIATLYSGISAGTELTHYRGTNPYRLKTWDPVRRLFLPVPDPAYYPRGTGYEEVGVVSETGSAVHRVKPGDIVFGTWQHCSTFVMEEGAAAENRLPEGLEPIQGIFSQMGPIALNGVLDAGIRVGEWVAVFGLGIVGLICVQLARLSGARVIAIDPIAFRRDLAAAFGADRTAGAEQAAETIKDITGGGADICLEASGSAAALHQAIRSCAYQGTVVALGFYQGEGRGLFLGEEFHHNRIRVIASQIGGIGPELSARWSRTRLVRTVMDLQREGRLRLRELVTHRVPFRRAGEIYRQLADDPSKVLQAVLCFAGTPEGAA
jgi:2-desacetyl-2-hydroxyethyl bacteriochlorophyllide A dehydrogenase